MWMPFNVIFREAFWYICSEMYGEVQADALWPLSSLQVVIGLL